MVQRKEFERVAPTDVGIDSRDIQWLLDQLEMGFTEPHGLMIMRHGKICAEGWWNPYGPGVRHGLQSHTKTYAATAIGIAYTEGLLKLNEKIVDIFPDEIPQDPSDNLKAMTVHDVLCMGCGMDEMPRPTQTWIRDFLATPVCHKPGITYMYNSTGSSLLGAIIKKKTGMGLHAYLKPRLYDKIGILSDNHRWLYMPDGLEIGGGGLFATLEDNLRLMKLYADGGVWDGEQILAPEYVKAAVSLQNESASEARVNPPAKDNFVGYGYQIWMCRPKGVYRADGAMGQFTIVVPDKDMIIAITENAQGAHWAQATLDTIWAFLERIQDHPADKIYEEDQKIEDEKLKQRMKRLALPNPVYAPYSPLVSQITGHSYRVEDGLFDLTGVSYGQMMTGSPAVSGTSEFSMTFEDDCCILSWKDNGGGRLEIAMDGTRRYNRLSQGTVTQVLASGAWIRDDQLEVVTRWVETCSEQKRIFTFTENALEITTEESMLFGMNTGKNVKCKCI